MFNLKTSQIVAIWTTIATLLQAQGKAGPVYMVNVVAPRKQAKNILRLVNEVDARSFVTIEEARRVVRGYRRLVK
jgi:uncharacterized protein YebE (UPF0316 family)